MGRADDIYDMLLCNADSICTSPFHEQEVSEFNCLIQTLMEAILID